MNTNFKVIGLTRLGIKSKSTAQETDALTTRPSEPEMSKIGVGVGVGAGVWHFFSESELESKSNIFET